jgi:hypothetical protein
MNEAQFQLRHSVKPYALIGTLLIILGILGLWIGFAASSWGGFWMIVIVAIVYGLKVSLFDFRYSISFRDDSIAMQVASWHPTSSTLTIIEVSDITSIKRETSDLRTLSAQRRVSQRIAIYDDQHKKVVDVSLKHFVESDIRKLMDTIHKMRPELQIPEGWI